MTATTATITTEADYRPSYGAAAIAAALVFILYLVTLSPSTAMWDTSEYIAAAYTMGLPHPPGNPFFVILGRFFSILPIAPNVAERINILAALCSAVSAAMWFLVVERVLSGWFPRKWQRLVGGALAALIGATAFTVWAQSVVNEKVYTISLVGMAITAWLTVRWCDDPDGPRSDRILVLIAYLSGLGYANHMAGFLALPAVFVAVLVIRPRTYLRWKLVLAGLLGGSPGRATGGPVSPGRPYWVGERGPELFVPSSAGQVQPSAPMGGRTVNVAISINAGGGDAAKALQQSSRQVARAVKAAIEGA